MKNKTIFVVSIIVLIGSLSIVGLSVNRSLNSSDKSPFFPSDVSKGIIVCHDPMAGKPVFIPFEKFPRINNNWIELKDLDGKKVVLINLSCVITYEPKEES